MCVYSMVVEHFTEKWQPLVVPPPSVYPARQWVPAPPPISAEEIAEFRKLLERAREYDKRNHEPECEDTEKKRIIKELADKLGVDISFIDATPVK